MLSDRSIRFHALANQMIVPFNEDQLQPASYDVLLGDEYMDQGRKHTMKPPAQLRLLPGAFILGTTHETVSIPDTMSCRIEGKSTLGRLGLAVHITAGFVDPGFHGRLTLEIKNHGLSEVRLEPGMRIAQLSFQELDMRCQRPYGHPDLGSKYQGQTTVVGAL